MLQQQKIEIERFVHEQGYLRVEEVNKVKVVKLIEQPGFFESIIHFFFKPKCERYETVCMTLFELMEANPELAKGGYRLAPFLCKNAQNAYRIRTIVEGYAKPFTPLRLEALNKRGDCKILCANNQVVYAHIAILNKVEWFQRMLAQPKLEQLKEVTLSLSEYTTHQVEAFLDCIYDGQVHGHLTAEDRSGLYSLLDYINYLQAEEVPSFFQDLENSDFWSQKFLLSLSKHQ